MLQAKGFAKPVPTTVVLDQLDKLMTSNMSYAEKRGFSWTLQKLDKASAVQALQTFFCASWRNQGRRPNVL